MRCPRDRGAQQELAPAERKARTGDPPRQLRPDRAAHAQADEEHRQDQRERIGRRAEEQRQDARPHHLCAERGHPRQRDRDVDEPRFRTDRCASGRAGRRHVGGDARDGQRQERHRDVERHGHERRGRHVEDPQEVKAREQAADDRAPDVAAVEIPEPRHAGRRRLDEARDRRQRRAHQDRRRQQADAGDDRPQKEVDLPGAGDRRVDAADQRHHEQHDHAQGTDTELEKRVDAERMMACADKAREQQAAEAHAAHEDAEQDAKRDGRGSNRELEELEPDNFIYESRAAGSDKEDKQRGQPAAPRIRCRCRQVRPYQIDSSWPNISDPPRRSASASP